MAVYAIGDLQGCYTPLRKLLDELHFDDHCDRLLLTGDLVNRGLESLQVLRFVKSLSAAAVSVLGNHDLHLLAVAHGGKPGVRDTLDAVLRAPDREELLDWLRQQPLAYEEPRTRMLMIHAGLPPQWTRAQTLALAAQASAAVRDGGQDLFFDKMYGNQPDRWDENLEGMLRLRFIVNCLTRMRYCTREGVLDFHHKGPPGSQPADLLPWFEVPGRNTAQDTILCGHWSSLGRVHWPASRVYGLDTGCAWGAGLTALNLETGELTRQSCADNSKA